MEFVYPGKVSNSRNLLKTSWQYSYNHVTTYDYLHNVCHQWRHKHGVQFNVFVFKNVLKETLFFSTIQQLYWSLFLSWSYISYINNVSTLSRAPSYNFQQISAPSRRRETWMNSWNIWTLTFVKLKQGYRSLPVSFLLVHTGTRCRCWGCLRMRPWTVPNCHDGHRASAVWLV